jgi:hypothetical protein
MELGYTYDAVSHKFTGKERDAVTRPHDPHTGSYDVWVL